MYPKMVEVEAADRVQLARWVWFLPSPGARAVGQVDFNEALTREAAILCRILERFQDLGGFTPGISKLIGLGN